MKKFMSERYIRLSLFGLLPLVLSSCATTDEPDLKLPNLEKQHSKFECQILNYLTLSAASNGTRGIQTDVTLTPFVHEEDTVMYVAQYQDGWELLSSDRRYPMLIMKGDKGTFNFGDFNPAMKDYIYGVADEIHTIKTDDADLPTDPSWDWMTMASGGGYPPSGEIPDFDHGEWVLINVIDHGTNITQIPHMIETQWGQGSPWNIYMPKYADGTLWPVGCTAVAIGQYAYYLHHKDGVPQYANTQAVYDSASNKYIFSSPSSTVWTDMALEWWDYWGTRQVATFLGDVAQIIGSYSQNKTEGTKSDYVKSINLYLQPQTSYNFEILQFNSNRTNTVLSQLRLGYPILARADRIDESENYKGHAFIIDAYKTEVSDMEYVYGWDGLTMSGRDPNAYNMDGTIAIYGIQKSMRNTTSQTYFGINWGYEGIGSDIWCETSNWELNDSTGYNLNRQIVIKK